MLLEVKNLDAGYGYLQILRDVCFEIDTGEYICLIGPNGAGKSTTLKSIAGILRLMKGEILFNGECISGLAGHRVARKGISYISEEMNLFTNMSVEENLLMGAYTVRDKAVLQQRLQFVYGMFSRLIERRHQLAGTMSGGERKMLAIARGLMSAPSLLMVDEPSFGLAPQMTELVFNALEKLNAAGTTILVVEQNVSLTLSVASRGYVLENGKITLKGDSCDLAKDPHVRKAFLGI